MYFLLVSSFFCHAQNEQRLILWYNKPSGDQWENALPIGNGRQGAMIYGNVDTERVQLNEHTLWSGSPNRNDNPLAMDSLAEIRKLIFSGKQKEAEQLANRVIVSQNSHGQMFEPAGELRLVFPGLSGYTHYYRELDIENAETKTSFLANGITYTREAIASFTDRVIVIRLTASKPNSISFRAFYSTPQPKTTIKSSGRDLLVSGTTIDHENVKGKVRYQVINRFKTQGGSIHSSDTSVSFHNADTVTIYISIATNFINYHDLGGDEQKRQQSLSGESCREILSRTGTGPSKILIRNILTGCGSIWERPMQPSFPPMND